MAAKNKYLLILIGSALVFIYVCVTEIADRFGEVQDLYAQLRQRESDLLTPEKLSEKKHALQLRAKELTLALFLGDQTYGQSPTGVVEFLGACAKKSNVHFESLTPSGVNSQEGINELDFKIASIAKFDQVGHLVNEMESGSFSIRLKKLELVSKPPVLSTLRLELEGSAFILKN